MGASSLIVLMISAVAFSGIAILISKFVLKPTNNKQKGEPYECGIPTRARVGYNSMLVIIYLHLIFLIFDVELIFLYPWAVVVKSVGWIALLKS